VRLTGDNRPFYASWQARGMLGPQLEFRCLGDGLYRLELSDLTPARAYREALAAMLQHAVDQGLDANPDQRLESALPSFLRPRQP
jgi:hypothetical protein